MLINDLFYLMMFSLFFGLWLFCSMSGHMLSILLSLEFMVVSIFLLFILSLGMSSFFYSLIYLIITACEGALGLSVLVIMSRSHGGDYFKNFDFYLV